MFVRPKQEPIVIYRKRYEKNPEWTVICEEHHGNGTYTKYIDGKLLGTFKTDAGSTPSAGWPTVGYLSR